MVATLGRLDQLDGELDSVINGLLKASGRQAASTGAATPAIVFESARALGDVWTLTSPSCGIRWASRSCGASFAGHAMRSMSSWPGTGCGWSLHTTPCARPNKPGAATKESLHSLRKPTNGRASSTARMPAPGTADASSPTAESGFTVQAILEQGARPVAGDSNTDIVYTWLVRKTLGGVPCPKMPFSP